MITYLLFIIGFIFLIKGADLFVDGAASFAKKFRVSELLIGLTIVAFGTSAPELIVNIFATAQGNTEIAISNILGSNLFNILIILGISACIFPLKITKNTVWLEIPLSFFAVVLLAVLVNSSINADVLNVGLTLIEGVMLLILFSVFLGYIIRMARQQRQTYRKENEYSRKEYGWWGSFILIIIGMAAINIGAKWVVDGAIVIARNLAISESFIALTIVAIGTSLPELITSVMAAFKKNADIAVGNIVGSNIFNVLWILGISAIIRPLPFQVEDNINILMVLVATGLLFLTMFTGKKRYLLERWEGIMFLVIYFVYMLMFFYFI